MQRIIFLDIDGPVIPAPIYYLDGNVLFNRSFMSTTALGYISRLATLGKALIVTNSAHNWFNTGEGSPDYIPVRNLKQDLIRHGLKENQFHDIWRTEFPNPRNRKFSESDPSGRMLAINNWIEDNGPADWIGFDDEKYTSNKRLIHIDFELGIDYKAFVKACKVWDIDPNSLIIY